MHDEYEAAFNPAPEKSEIQTRRSSKNLGGDRPMPEKPGQLINDQELQTFDMSVQMQIRDCL